MRLIRIVTLIHMLEQLSTDGLKTSDAAHAIHTDSDINTTTKNDANTNINNNMDTNTNTNTAMITQYEYDYESTYACQQ